MNFLRECGAHNRNNFTAVVEQMSAEEMLVIRRVVSS